MKCPHCKVQIASPSSQHSCVDGVEVLVLVCPECETILGIVNHSHSGYFSRTRSTRGSTR